jgi:hypothetical protein
MALALPAQRHARPRTFATGTNQPDRTSSTA